MVRMSLSPLDAHTAARPMPVLPLVGSMMVVFLVILPAFIASLIILNAILSLTEDVGFINSHLPKIVAPDSLESELIFTKGVFPISSSILLAIIYNPPSLLFYIILYYYFWLSGLNS